MDHLTLGWTRGEFRAPLICMIDGEPRRALRRLTIGPGPRSSPYYMNRLILHDLEAPEGATCQDSSGADEPNAVGVLGFVFEDKSRRPDLATHEFETTLRREGGFDFQVISGRLQVGPPGEPKEGLPWVDFRGGKARFDMVARGSDSHRRLAEFGKARKLRMTLEALDGTRLHFEIVEWQRGGPSGRPAAPPR